MRIVSLEAITRLHKQARGLRRAARSLHSQARQNADPSWTNSTDRLDALVREHVGLLEAVLDALVEEDELAMDGTDVGKRDGAIRDDADGRRVTHSARDPHRARRAGQRKLP
jgi:hypothetical protein